MGLAIRWWQVQFPSAVLSSNNLRQVDHTHVPLLSAGRSGLLVACLSAVWAVVFIMTGTAINSLGQWAPVPGSTQPSTLCGTAKWVSAFRLSNINKCWWWMWIVAAYWRTYSQSWLAWFEGRQPSCAQSAFIKWTRWTLTMASPWW